MGRKELGKKNRLVGSGIKKHESKKKKKPPKNSLEFPFSANEFFFYVKTPPTWLACGGRLTRSRP